jgi:hypothetical protein
VYKRRRGNLVLGIILILMGGWFLATQFYPGLEDLIPIRLTWPLIMVAVGLFLLVFGVLTGGTGMAVPAAIVGGLGVLFYWQDATNNWESWAYVWTLIPGFVGVGVLLDGLLSGRFRQAWGGGMTLIVISAVMFVIFGSFLGGPISMGDYWPVLLILLGVWMLVSMLLGSRRTSAE